MGYRVYDPHKDREAVRRIWREIGWIDPDHPEPCDILVENGRAIVADVSGQPECVVSSLPGDMDYVGERLKFSAITGVATSLVARRRGLGSRLTAAKIALDAGDGAVVCGLGMFDQGYYDRLGFGTGSYEHVLWCSPATLRVHAKPRVPTRLSKEDWEAVHQSRLLRLRGHGSLSLSRELTKAEMHWAKHGFGLGYTDEQGQLTHHLWMEEKGREHGPLEVCWMAYRDYGQCLELLSLLKSLGDQIHLVRIPEPPTLQLQDLLERPTRYRAITQGSAYHNRMEAYAAWQIRICDLQACLQRTHLEGKPVRFNLTLTDPIAEHLDEDACWKGISANYVVSLGPESSAENRAHKTLPTMGASVGAFTRMWLGVRCATSLAFTDTLSAPEGLLKALDRQLRLPDPKLDWPF